MFIFLSYAHHALDGIRHQCEPTFDELHQREHTANEHEVNVRHLCHSILPLVDDLNDQSNSKHQQIIQLVKNQLDIAKMSMATLHLKVKLLLVHPIYPNLR